MSDHEEILDSGEYVCIKCGIVSGQEYIYKDDLFKNQIHKNTNLRTYSSICNILDHLNLNTICYADKVNDLIDKYLSNFKCKSELKIGACIFDILSSSDLACS